MKLVTEKLVGEEIRPSVSTEFHGATLSIKSIATSRRDESGVAGPLGAEVDRTIEDSETFQYSYECQHCGHKWTEEHAEDLKVKGERETGFTGDQSSIARSSASRGGT